MSISIHQVISMLPNTFKNLIIKKNRAFSDSISYCYHSSRSYEDKQIWWSSASQEEMRENDYLILALEHCGILIIPCSVIKKYWIDFNPGNVSHGRKNIRIKKHDNIIVLYNRRNQPEINITNYITLSF